MQECQSEWILLETWHANYLKRKTKIACGFQSLDHAKSFYHNLCVFGLLIGRSEGILKRFVALESYSSGNVTLHLKGLPIQELSLIADVCHKCTSFPAMFIFIGGALQLRGPVCPCVSLQPLINNTNYPATIEPVLSFS